MAHPAGPVFAAGRFEEFVINDETGEQYTILFLPDKNNDDLQREGKSAYYYYIPEQVRLSQKGDTKDKKFMLTHFVGTLGQDTHVGVEGNSEVVGGVLAFTVTSRYPTSVMKKAQEQLIARCRSKRDDKYWFLYSRPDPMIAIAPIVSNTTVITNLSPEADGSAPGQAVTPQPTPSPAPAPAPGGGNGGGVAPAAGGGEIAPRNDIQLRDFNLPLTVPHGRAFRAPSNLDAWAWKMQGQGPGSITGGENAYSGLIGAYPSEILWAGFHGAYSPIVVAQNMQLAVWSELLHLKITGSWEKIASWFSTHGQGRAWWFSADIKAEFNKLRTTGGIKVELSIDGTAPNAAKLEEEINKRIDLVYNKFMEQAQKMIFDPAPPTVEPAKASGGGIFSSLFGGGGFALKYRKDTTQLNLHYEETRSQRYLQPHTISSSLEGFYNEIKRDPANEKKYFTRLVLGDLSRKVKRLVTPAVNWASDPIASVSAQIGYPGPAGSVQWTGQLFQGDSTWSPVMAQRMKSEVATPPSGWEPDMTFIKRKVHFKEPPRESDSPYNHTFVEKPTVELDPEPNGTLSNDIDVIVRAAATGLLDVGPMSLDLVLQDSTQQVDVEFKAEGRTHDGRERAITKFTWKFENQAEPRIWKVYTGQMDFVPRYQYRVTCIVKGSFFSKGMTWTGPWVQGAGNGPLTISVPMADDPNVTKRNLSFREILSDEPIALGADSSRPSEVSTLPQVPTAPPAPVPVAGDGGDGRQPVATMAPSAPVDRSESEEMVVAGYGLMPESAARTYEQGMPPPTTPMMDPYRDSSTAEKYSRGSGDGNGDGNGSRTTAPLILEEAGEGWQEIPPNPTSR